MERQRFDHAVIGIDDDGTIYTLEYVFDDKNGFAGAVGSMFTPVSAAYCREQNTLAAVKDKWESATGETINQGKARELRDHELDYCGKDFFLQDNSYCYYYDEIKKQAKVKFKTLECIGGGRIFSNFTGFKTIINQQLLDLINAYESGKVKL